jgi:AbrB family looped-hinge helix DNA binding protein
MAANHGAPSQSSHKTLNISIDKTYYGIDMDTVTVSPKFQVVIPQSVRDRVGVKPGDRMVVLQKGDVIYLVRVGDIRSMKGFAKGVSSKGVRDESERFG